jgi:succinyl-diaminopimelate desuccinylase
MVTQTKWVLESSPEEESSVKAAEKWIEEHEQQLIEDICELVKIPSVSVTTNDPKAPFGPECLRALECALGIGERMGFAAENHEHYCGSLYWRGEKDSEIGVFGHADVVPAGNGWEYEPFSPTVKDGIIIGRGASDNKGSSLIALYAMYYLKDQGYKPKNSFRFFIGCSEERSMEDIEYYTKNYKEPEFSIVPDVRFPVCNGEKGILEIDAECQIESNVLLHFSSGVASNAVPSEASATLKIGEEQANKLETLGAQIQLLDDGLYQVSVQGIAAHAAFPEGSESAEVKLVRVLSHSGVLDQEADALMKAVCILFGDYYGAGLGVPYEDEASGKLTHVGGVASFEKGIFHQNINIRYNVTADYDAMIQMIKDVLNRYGFAVERIQNSSPFYIDKQEPIVQKLVEICNTRLGTDLDTYIMGGGTYARKLKNAVGFGPGIPSTVKRFGTERGSAHQPDEYVEIEDLKKAFVIYVEALKALDVWVAE